MEWSEELAVTHICHDQDEFVHPRPDLGEGWHSPSFLAINVRAKHIAVVEVSTAADMDDLLERVNDYEALWLERLKAHPVFGGLIEDGYHFHVKVYLREDLAQDFRDRLTVSPKDRVKIRTFEEIGYPWEWEG